ncbi:hypothetical protein [Halosimplex salinum]|uniref:hypothetical protein n=1 Tax=Halosimplex salinum TaxID=1710538 RepID=UPI0013DDB3B8|nr:hypothetical protein [Halosimplex salinum]
MAPAPTTTSDATPGPTVSAGPVAEETVEGSGAGFGVLGTLAALSGGVFSRYRE